MTTELLTRGWRPALAALVEGTRDSLTVASPYIKRREAEWLSDRLAPGVRLTVLTEVESESVRAAALDLDALLYLASDPIGANVLTLPRLHAKVFVADASSAIVTSANLTTPGLDWNLEYGVFFHEPDAALRIRRDLESYARLGNRLDVTALTRLVPVGEALRAADRVVADTASAGARARFNQALREARQQFSAAHVGGRSANALFSQAILRILERGPQRTATMALAVQQLLPPDLCNDAEELVINGERYGKAWKHRLRNAQQHLKRTGEIVYGSALREWSLPSGVER